MMTTRILRLMLILSVAGCASIATFDEKLRFVGLIEHSQKIKWFGDSLSPDAIAPIGAAFGLIGALVAVAASSPNPIEINQYDIRVDGNLVSIMSDDDWPVGTCVEVIPQSNAAIGSYRKGKLSRSNKCAPHTTLGDK